MSRRSSNAGRIVAIILAMIVGATIVLGIIFRKQLAVVWGDLKRYVKRVDDEVPKDEDKDNEANAGTNNGENAGTSSGVNGSQDNMAVSDIDYSGVTLAMVPMVASELSAQAESGLNITATIIPAQATDKTLDWSVEFVDASSEWANGKTATDYVTVTGTETGATVECLNPFGAQLLVKATSRSNPDVYATCTLDYYARVIGANLNFNHFNPFGEDNTFPMTKASKQGNVTVVPSLEDMGNESITDDLCISSISIDFEFSDYTIPLNEEDATITEKYEITTGFRDYLHSNGFPMDVACVGGTPPMILPVFLNDVSCNIKYFGLQWQFINSAIIQMMKPSYTEEGGFAERIKDVGAEYLALANSYTEPAVVFSASYKDSMNDVSFYISLSYQKDYFTIDVENLEFDQTGAVM